MNHVSKLVKIISTGYLIIFAHVHTQAQVGVEEEEVPKLESILHLGLTHEYLITQASLGKV